MTTVAKHPIMADPGASGENTTGPPHASASEAQLADQLAKANEKIATMERIAAQAKKSANGGSTAPAGPSTKKAIKRKKSTPKSSSVVGEDDDEPQSAPEPPKKKRSKRKDDDEALPAKEVIVTDAQKVDAAKKNPEGVRLANANMEGSIGVLAGYLFFKDTIRLKLWMEDEPLIDTFIKERERNFGIPNARPNLSWERKSIFKFIKTADLKLQRATLPLQVSDNHQGVNHSNTSVGNASWAVTIMNLIRQFPARFPDTAKAETHKTGAFASEDINRAYWALRCQWRLLRNKIAGKGRFANYEANPPVFLTDNEIRTLKAKPDGSLVTADVKDSTEPALAESFLELRDELLDMQEKTTELDLDWSQSGDVLNVVRADAEATKDMTPEERSAYQTQVWEERAKEEGHLWETQLNQLGTTDHSQIGRRVSRPPLTAAQLESFLRAQARKLKGRVIHDEAYIRQQPTAERYIQQAEVEQSLIGTREQEAESSERGSEPAAATAFWDLQGTIASVSVPTPSYEDSCTLLGLQASRPALDPKDSSAGALVLKPWQVTGAAWMDQSEDSFIHGGVVADDCGLGKTILTLYHIYHGYQKKLAAKEAGLAVDFRPTLIVCPAGLIDVWYSEWNTLFRDKLIMRQFYGSEKMYSAERRAFILPSGADDLARLLQGAYAPSNPDAGRLVILSSLTSWESRTMNVLRKSEYDEKKRKAKLARGGGPTPQGKGKRKASSAAGKHLSSEWALDICG
jgi:SNF2-related domain